MAMSNYIEQLNKTDDPARWLQRFEAVAKWQGWKDDSLRSAFLALINHDGYNIQYLQMRLLRNNQLNGHIKNLPICCCLSYSHKNWPWLHAIYYFSHLKQKSADSVLTYIRKIRNAAENCQFGAQLEDRLRDRLVFGIRSAEALQKMLTEKLEVLTLKKATEIALAHETIQENPQSWTGYQGESSAVCHFRKNPIAKQKHSKMKANGQ